MKNDKICISLSMAMAMAGKPLKAKLSFIVIANRHLVLTTKTAVIIEQSKFQIRTKKIFRLFICTNLFNDGTIIDCVKCYLNLSKSWNWFVLNFASVSPIGSMAFLYDMRVARDGAGVLIYNQVLYYRPACALITNMRTTQYQIAKPASAKFCLQMHLTLI